MVKWNENTKSKWDHQAVNWDKRSRDMWEDGSRKDIIPFFNKHTSTDGLVLDIGCGSGYGSHKLKSLGYNVTGIDLSERMIELAKESLGSEVPFYVGSVDELPFESNSFDYALLINVIEWTENPIDALIEIKRVLKKGGMLCAGLLGATSGPRANSYQRLYKKEVVMNTMMPWEFFQLAKENGFTLMEQHVIHKNDVDETVVSHLPDELKQAISFMTLFMLKKE
ncbi:MAG TPA: class I SAM-dependent methyltransferase [Pseudogracilibacillus sp.]|nr:class I SAM-dependent methyltransferase [Pseudogracilibacillus sp.]